MDKIICVGKNYLEHAKELGDAVPERPVLFLKPPSVLRAASKPGERLRLRLPPGATEVHHECEIVLLISRDGYRMSVAEARAAIGAVSLGLDMTLRDVQTRLKKQGHPWEVSKAFLDAAVVGPWIDVKGFEGYLNERFSLTVDGLLKQSACGREMSLKPEECVAYASEHFQLKAGDLVFTGTPAGVGPVRPGQTAELVWGERLRYAASWETYSS